MSKSVRSCSPVSKSTSNGRRLRLTDPKKRAHIEAYLASGQTQQAYCAAHGLKLSNFKNWRLRYEQEPVEHFAPVITPETFTVSSDGIGVEITKGDCKLVISGVVEVSSVIVIIRELLTCS